MGKLGKLGKMGKKPKKAKKEKSKKAARVAGVEVEAVTETAPKKRTPEIDATLADATLADVRADVRAEAPAPEPTFDDPHDPLDALDALDDEVSEALQRVEAAAKAASEARKAKAGRASEAASDPLSETLTVEPPEGHYAVLTLEGRGPVAAWMPGYPVARGPKSLGVYDWPEPGPDATRCTVRCAPGHDIEYVEPEPGMVPDAIKVGRGRDAGVTVVLRDAWDRTLTPACADLQSGAILDEINGVTQGEVYAIDPFAGTLPLAPEASDIRTDVTGLTTGGVPWEAALKRALKVAAKAAKRAAKASKKKAAKKWKKRRLTRPPVVVVVSHPPDDPVVLRGLVETAQQSVNTGVLLALYVCRDRLWDLPVDPSLASMAYMQPLAWATPGARKSTRRTSPPWGWLFVGSAGDPRADALTLTRAIAVTAARDGGGTWAYTWVLSRVPDEIDRVDGGGSDDDCE